MKKFIIPFILLFILSGCSMIHKNIELKSYSPLKHTTTDEDKESADDKVSEQATFEEQLDKMLEEIDNLDFEDDDDGFPDELK